jgi:hypothetical protein
MRKLTALVFAAVATVAFAVPAAATVINLDGINNASLDGHNAVSQMLGAGTYKVSFVEDQYTAFSRWNQIAGCDNAGQNCRQGWENSAVIMLGSSANTFFLGDGNAHGGYGPVPVDAYFSSAAQSFKHSGMYSQLFTLTVPTDVSFFIADDKLQDNRGGVSLSVAQVPVPEPAPWPLLLTGLGIMGALLHLRQRKATCRAH